MGHQRAKPTRQHDTEKYPTAADDHGQQYRHHSLARIDLMRTRQADTFHHNIPNTRNHPTAERNQGQEVG